MQFPFHKPSMGEHIERFTPIFGFMKSKIMDHFWVSCVKHGKIHAISTTKNHLWANTQKDLPPYLGLRNGKSWSITYTFTFTYDYIYIIFIFSDTFTFTFADTYIYSQTLVSLYILYTHIYIYIQVCIHIQQKKGTCRLWNGCTACNNMS